MHTAADGSNAGTTGPACTQSRWQQHCSTARSALHTAAVSSKCRHRVNFALRQLTAQQSQLCTPEQLAAQQGQLYPTADGGNASTTRPALYPRAVSSTAGPALYTAAVSKCRHSRVNLHPQKVSGTAESALHARAVSSMTARQHVPHSRWRQCRHNKASFVPRAVSSTAGPALYTVADGSNAGTAEPALYTQQLAANAGTAGPALYTAADGSNAGTARSLCTNGWISNVIT